MARASVKKNMSSTQVLKTLKILLQGDYSMQEILAQLNTEEKEPIFNNSIVSKYINTCRYCNIDIHKIHNKYFVVSLPFGLDLTDADINLIQDLQNITKNDLAKKYFNIFGGFLTKLNRFSNKKITRIEKKEFKYSFEMFEHAVKQKRKVRLLFKNKTDLVCVPLTIREENKKTYFVVYEKRERMIDVGRLSGVEILSDKFVSDYAGDQSVIYVIKEPLADKYELKENETVLSKNGDGSITITNRCESKEALFARLLRYDDKCEILNPKVYREEMKQILDGALSNYGA